MEIKVLLDKLSVQYESLRWIIVTPAVCSPFLLKWIILYPSHKPQPALLRMFHPCSPGESLDEEILL